MTKDNRQTAKFIKSMIRHLEKDYDGLIAVLKQIPTDDPLNKLLQDQLKGNLVDIVQDRKSKLRNYRSIVVLGKLHTNKIIRKKKCLLVSLFCYRDAINRRKRFYMHVEQITFHL